jgi:class 3 adenylate cyclase
MSWSQTRAEQRIRQSLQTVPSKLVNVKTYEERVVDVATVASFSLDGRTTPPPLLHIPPSTAVVVDGVHVYLQLIDYHAVLQDTRRESEARHRRALQFLHIHYSACDQIVREFGAQRVDFHGPRLHAVMATPPGKANERLRLERAMEFANALARMVEETGRSVSNGEFQTRTRIGIDTGKAIAVNSGRGDEPEPLFLGRPANYAAKLADGDEEGIYLSDRARSTLGYTPAGSLVLEKSSSFNLRSRAALPSAVTGVTDARIRTLSADVRLRVEPAIRDVNFRFHQHTPPLRTIDYSLLSPSNSIHMPLVSIFADIDGFTKYVDDCTIGGKIAEMVSNLHAIRHELAAVLKRDFDGKKVRFIGDCLHGVMATGTAFDIDERETVRNAVLCAAAMRSSFDLCKTLLPGIQQLGLAIGVELGPTPITRLGIRGDFSVRCATSKAVSNSEDLQSICGGRESALGDRALAVAPRDIRDLFGHTGRVQDLTYSRALALGSENASKTPPLAAPALATSGGWVSRAAASENAVHSSGGTRHA